MKQQIYATIKEDLIEKIHNGTYKPGDKLPVETKLCEIYNASRSTIVKALKQLILEHYLTSIERVGYFVTDTTTNHYTFRYDFPNAHGDTRITSEERPVPRKKKIKDENGNKSIDAVQFCFVSKCSRTVIKYRKMFVIYKKGVFLDINKTTKEYWDKILNQVMRTVESTNINIDCIIPTGDLALELEVKDPILYFRLTRWDYDKYGKAMAYYETYIKADAFSINASSK